jgi:ABC-type nickel/cobalt efflux system permease component RcnA
MAVLLFLQPFQAVARDNPFVSEKAPEKEVKLPSVASKLFAKIILWQSKLNAKLTEQVKKLKTDWSWEALFPLILISFLYGIIHAAGPGHGKVVVFSYFISRRSEIKKGLILGNLISIFHAVSGMIIVLTLYFIVKTTYLTSFEAISQKVKLVSYSLIIVIGIILLLTSLFPIKNLLSRNPDNDVPADSPGRRGLLPLALAVGIVPCPGVVIIMLFALSFNLLITGIIMSFIMALGMASTISLAGLLSILGQEGLLRSFSRKERAQYLIQKGLTIFGSLLLIGFGTMLLVSL